VSSVLPVAEASKASLPSLAHRDRGRLKFGLKTTCKWSFQTMHIVHINHIVPILHLYNFHIYFVQFYQKGGMFTFDIKIKVPY
jgi:hypothetical protein